jgi:alkylated DNA repair dioxygenase AlkB
LKFCRLFDLTGNENEALTHESVEKLRVKPKVVKEVFANAMKTLYLAALPLCNGYYRPSTENPAVNNDSIDVSRALDERFEKMQNDMLSKMSDMMQQNVVATHHEDQAIHTAHPQPPVEKQPLLSAPMPPTSPPTHSFKSHETFTPDYLSGEEQRELTELLDSETFVPEKGRGVLQYGAKYTYMGSKTSVKETIPPAVQKLLDKLNSCVPEEKDKLNSVLINKFKGADSFLPEHSDDEYSIGPTSKIFTVSLGDSRLVKFKDIFTEDESSVDALPGSLYVMTRDSQAVYRHRIDKDDNFKDKCRYSLTFRKVHWTHLNSTIINGDSNSRPIEFGEGRGKVGKATPGRRVEAIHIEDISPNECVSYKNVVLVAGTNNLKRDDVVSESQVVKLVERYRDKITEIRRFNRNCNIHIVPVIPTRSKNVNDKVRKFNEIVVYELVKYFPKLFIVGGTQEYADYNGFLSYKFAKNPDRSGLHLNKFGISHLVRNIKHSIFEAKNRGSVVHSHRSFSDSVKFGMNFPSLRR